jgi:hypothetical protein
MSAGKGDKPRPGVYGKKYNENFDLIKKSKEDITWDKVKKGKKTKIY